MTAIVAVGAQVRLGRDEPPLGASFAEIEIVDGGTVERRLVRDPDPGVALDLRVFVDLADGRRIVAPEWTEGIGVDEGAGVADVTVAARHAVLADAEVGELCHDLGLSPSFVAALQQEGEALTAETVTALPFVVELDHGARKRLGVAAG